MKDLDSAVALNADLAKGLHNVLEAIVLLNSALNLFIYGLASSKATHARKASSAKNSQSLQVAAELM